MAIFQSIQDLRIHLDAIGDTKEIYMTSGGFDPLHIGHVRCILGTAHLANNRYKYPIALKPNVVIVVNADSFLERKKGYAFMPLAERMEIINALEGVDYVVPWEAVPPDQTVIEAIRALKPNYFTKGGDRFDASTIPEWNICQEIGCQIITGVGSGGKIQSSSELIQRANKQFQRNNIK
tara:strand:+ start:6134 stop:6670 length:537 start_codon:yes stop_codon:yes gene_type:complete